MSELYSHFLLCIISKGWILLASEEIYVNLVSCIRNFFIQFIEYVVQIFKFIFNALLIINGACRSGLRPLWHTTKCYLLAASSATHWLMMHHGSQHVSLLGRHFARCCACSGRSQNFRLGSIKAM